jgi:hypothetical protein
LLLHEFHWHKISFVRDHALNAILHWLGHAWYCEVMALSVDSIGTYTSYVNLQHNDR